jgi:hypothetical protein
MNPGLSTESGTNALEPVKRSRQALEAMGKV